MRRRHKRDRQTTLDARVETAGMRGRYVALGFAVLVPLSVLRVLFHFQIPLGKPNKFVYLYSEFAGYRMLFALPALVIAAVAGGSVLLLGSSRRSSRVAGLSLAAASVVALSIWSYLAPPGHVGQHVFNFSSPSQDGAFVTEAHTIDDARSYLAAFPQRARTPPEVMRGTRVISNPPATTMLVLGLRKVLAASPALRTWLARPYQAEIDRGEQFPPGLVERSSLGLLTALTLTALWGLSVVPAYALCRIYLPPPAAAALAFCCLASPMTLTLTPGKDAAQLLTVNLALWLWLLACQRRAPLAALLAGVAAVGGIMVGLIHMWIGLAALLAAGLHAVFSTRDTLKFSMRCVLPLAIGAAATIAALRVLLDCDVLAIVLAVSRSQAEATRGEGSMPLLWQMLGLPLFVLFAGSGLWSLCLWQRGDKPPDAALSRLGLYLIAPAALVMVATVGFTNLETPRLWIPFVPLLLLGLALRLRLFRKPNRRDVTLLAALVACQLAASSLQWTMMDMRESEIRLSTGSFFDKPPER